MVGTYYELLGSWIKQNIGAFLIGLIPILMISMLLINIELNFIVILLDREVM